MVEADILRGLECKSVVKVGSESVDCLARSQRPIRYRSNNESECPCTRKLKAGHTSPFTSVRIEKSARATVGRGCHALRRALRRHTRSTVYVAGVSRSAL